MIIAETIFLLSVSTAMAAERGTEPWLPTSTPVRAVQSAPTPDVDDSVAITVFSNISGAAPDDWIGTGIVETLVAELEGAGGVSVVGRQAVSGAIEQLSAEGRSAEATEETEVAAGRLLGARWVISGGYQRLGDRMRITARVVEVATATVVHTAIVDGTVTDLFALQDRLAAELRQGLPARGSAVAPSRAASALRGEPATVEPPASVSAGATTAAEAPSGASFAAAPTIVIDGPPPPVAPEVVSRDAQGRVTLRAIPLGDDEPLRLDGQLDERVYHSVPPVTDFIQQEPDEGARATEQTEVWVMFDRDTIYIAARCWNSEPSRIVANEMKRDSFGMFGNETISVALDTFYDRRNGFSFLTNALGGLFDSTITNERTPNMDWNAVWDVKTGRFEQGWTVEIAIPFKSLRYRPGPAQIWGINLERRVAWKNETSFLTPIPASLGYAGSFKLSSAATLVGLEVPSSGTRLEVKPYAISDLTTDVNATPRLSNELGGDFGFDVKYGVTQGLTADLTYNTDFA